MSKTCELCMFDAPYTQCCKLGCGGHEFCLSCNAKSKEVMVVGDCPTFEVIIEKYIENAKERNKPNE